MAIMGGIAAAPKYALDYVCRLYKCELLKFDVAILSQIYQPSCGDGQMVALETDQCHLRQKLCYTNQMQYIVLFALFVCVLLFVVSLYYDTASRHSYCMNCRHSLDMDFTDRPGDGLFNYFFN